MRGVVIKMYGDKQIAGAIADGMNRVLEPDKVEVVKREIKNQNVQRSLLRIAVGNSKTSDDYEQMIVKARGNYEYIPQHGKLYGIVLGTWGLIWYCFYKVYDQLNLVTRGM